MTKTLSLLLLSATLALPAVAQQDPKAGKILDAMSTKYQAYKSYQADFTQTLENTSAKVKQNLSGNIIVAGQKFRLKLSGQEVINDGKTTWTYLKNENEVNITDTDPEAQDMSPSQIYGMYKKGYKYTYVQAATDGGEAVDVIELTPENRANDVFKVRIKVRKKDTTVKSWELFKKNGNRYSFTIKNFKPNVITDASTFSFDKTKYKGVKVVDLR